MCINYTSIPQLDIKENAININCSRTNFDPQEELENNQVFKYTDIDTSDQGFKTQDKFQIPS